jgi:hypothetical protein
MSYDPRDHYWSLKDGARPDEVFSSSRRTYVREDDAAFVRWLSDENQPTWIANETELLEVLALAGVSLPDGVAIPGSVKSRIAVYLDVLEEKEAATDERLKALESKTSARGPV